MNQSAADDETPLNPGDEGPPDAPGVGEDICQACRGAGTVEGTRCAVCGGTARCCRGSAVADPEEALTLVDARRGKGAFEKDARRHARLAAELRRAPSR
jgi:hypothetical protein